jgi:hypothetical protein
VIWEATYPDVRAMHLHPKDIGAAIVSLDQPSPPESWRWAGPNWQDFVSRTGASKIVEVTIGARDPAAMAQRWSEVLGTEAPVDDRIAISGGALTFARAPVDAIVEYRVEGGSSLPSNLIICGTRLSSVNAGRGAL